MDVGDGKGVGSCTLYIHMVRRRLPEGCTCSLCLNSAVWGMGGVKKVCAARFLSSVCWLLVALQELCMRRERGQGKAASGPLALP